MENIRQYNEEQFQMLCLAVADTTSGMCLFQSYDSDDQTEIAKRLQKMIRKKSCILDMSRIDASGYPDEIGKMRDLIKGYQDVSVVILCNLQLCGAAIGDRKYIQKLNHMRDQMFSMKKVWIFGMSPYFAVMLSREARDLYSCIMGHFEFYREDEKHELVFEDTEVSGDIRLSLRKLTELQFRIEHQGVERADLKTRLSMVTVWNGIYEYSRKDVVELIRRILIKLEEDMENIEFSPARCISFLEVVAARLHLEQYRRALYDAEVIKAKAEKLLPEQSREFGDICLLYGVCCLNLGEYGEAEESILRALSCYDAALPDYSKQKIKTIDILTQIKTMTGCCDEALDISGRLISEVEQYYGQKYDSLPVLWNNRGGIYVALGMLSEALQCFQKSNELLNALNSEKKGSKGNTLKNIGLIYGRMGDYQQAIRYLKDAEAVYSQLDPLLQKTKKVQMVYRLLAENYHKASEEELSEKYRSLAEQIIQ